MSFDIGDIVYPPSYGPETNPGYIGIVTGLCGGYSGARDVKFINPHTESPTSLILCRQYGINDLALYTLPVSDKILELFGKEGYPKRTPEEKVLLKIKQLDEKWKKAQARKRELKELTALAMNHALNVEAETTSQSGLTDINGVSGADTTYHRTSTWSLSEITTQAWRTYTPQDVEPYQETPLPTSDGRS